ncbi:fusion glycoprotein F0 [Prochlorococcus sp. AH-716-M10]|nr:fusion glycoprotein F0 [Prochlorococcus sp. AH-716-M10]
MKNIIYKPFFSIVMIGFLFIALPIRTYAESFNNIGDLFIVGQQKTIINYEKSQPSSIDNPVVDPNFNAMRDVDAESSSTSIYIVVGLLVAATLIPLATWWYFSK